MIQENSLVQENPSRKIEIEKIVLSAGARDKELDKAKKLLELISNMKAQILTTSKRIPNFNISPGMEVGTMVTIRGERALALLKRLLVAINNTLSEKQISQNHFSFGIKEYIEIPGIEYQRDIGIRGFNITVDFIRHGVRVKRKKIKSGKLPKKQQVTPEEIMNYMEENFQTSID